MWESDLEDFLQRMDLDLGDNEVRTSESDVCTVADRLVNDMIKCAKCHNATIERMETHDASRSEALDALVMSGILCYTASLLNSIGLKTEVFASKKTMLIEKIIVDRVVIYERGEAKE